MTYEQADLLLDAVLTLSKILLWFQVGVVGQLVFIYLKLVKIERNQKR